MRQRITKIDLWFGGVIVVYRQPRETGRVYHPGLGLIRRLISVMQEMNDEARLSMHRHKWGAEFWIR